MRDKRDRKNEGKRIGELISDRKQERCFSDKGEIERAVKRFDKWKISLKSRSNIVKTKESSNYITQTADKIASKQRARTKAVEAKWKEIASKRHLRYKQTREAVEAKIQYAFRMFEGGIKYLRDPSLTEEGRVYLANRLRDFVKEYVNPEYHPEMFSVIIDTVKSFQPNVIVNLSQVEEGYQPVTTAPNICVLHWEIAKEIKAKKRDKLFYQFLGETISKYEDQKKESEPNKAVSVEEGVNREITSSNKRSSNNKSESDELSSSDSDTEERHAHARNN